MTKTIKSMLRVDAPNSPKLEEMLDAAIAENADEIILDMEETEYICSVGLRVLIGTQKKLRDKTCKFIIRNVKPDIMEIFKVTGFTGILTIE
ncbi:MAG TPA: anti-sigma factor antagonist [Lachnospiraceae bacterium]|nr:anti-sigma factor antagonist [Lachnospiraceae bacterium]